MGKTSFLSNLLNGTSGAGAASAQDEDETPGNTLDAAAVQRAAANDQKAAVDEAVSAANTRWNTVMTSDAGKANPSAAARLLMKTPMAADDVIETLADMKPAPSGDDTGSDRQGNVAGTDADRLRGVDSQRQGSGNQRDANSRQSGGPQAGDMRRERGNGTNVDTGGAGGSDREAGANSARDRRQATAATRNKREEQRAGGVKPRQANG